jgi:carbamoyl-phosphate synthase large subunit
VTYRIAITGVGAVVGFGVIKSIRASRKFRDSHIVGIDCNPYAIGFSRSDTGRTVGKISSAGYIDSLVDICRADSVDLFIPLIEDEFLPVHDNLDRFTDSGTRVLIQPREVIENYSDKYLLTGRLKQYGIATPETLQFNRENYGGILEMGERLGFPLLLKPRFGRSSRGIHIVESKKQLDAYLVLLENKNYVLQEFLGSEDQEYTCAIFKTPSMERAYSIALKRQLLSGTTISAEVAFDDSLTEVCNRIASRVPFVGSLNVQLIKRDGVPYVFEINTRYSSSAFIRAMCGFNDVEMGIEYVLNGRVSDPPDIKKYRIGRCWEEIILSDN